MPTRIIESTCAFLKRTRAHEGKDTCFSITPHVLFVYAKNTGDKAYTHAKKNVTLHPFPKKESEKMYTFLS